MDCHLQSLVLWPSGMYIYIHDHAKMAKQHPDLYSMLAVINIKEEEEDGKRQKMFGQTHLY